MKRNTLLTILFLCLIFLFLGVCQISANSEIVLNTSVHYIEGLFFDIMKSLDIIAMTPEAKEGDWKGIKKYLMVLEKSTPGVYFYVLPNGDYYSVEMDFTGLNLKNREYFDSLFDGNNIKGFPIYSRSTGKKSALMAVPIFKEEIIVGALGASVFLDDISIRMKQEMGLPDNYTWYIVNESGLTMLNNNRDLIFMDIFVDGSPSLKEASREMFNNTKGQIEYDLGGIKRSGSYKILEGLNWWMTIVQMEGELTVPSLLRLSLEKFSKELRNSILDIDNSIKDNIKIFKEVAEPNIRNLLKNIYEADIFIVEGAFVDTEGIMRYIEPKDYINFEGEDISNYSHVQQMLNDPGKLLSDGFYSVEGFWSIALCYPLYDENNDYIGYLSILLRPELIIDSLIKKYNIPEDYELWVMQKDGLILYDFDDEEIGKNLFTDPLYSDFESLIALGKEMLSKPSGTGEYVFPVSGTDRKALKIVAWNTIKIYDTEWRIALAYIPFDSL